MLVVLIVACEISFWVVLLLGLSVRYVMGRRRLGGVLLMSVPLIDLVLLVAAVLHLRSGAPADVIVVDVELPWVLDPNELKSKCKNTPFDEARLTGRVVRTIVSGRTVYEYV